MSKVAVVKCSDYEDQNVIAAVRKIFSLLEINRSVKRGQNILLKPNLLSNLPPERGTTTHPILVRTIADELKLLGANPFIGDSPGGIGVPYESVLKETGMKALGLPIVSFEEKGMKMVSNPGGKISRIYISKSALEADMIINIPKLKTHELTTMTCGIKNMFGCVPGFHKVRYHFDAPRPGDFAEALVDLFENIRPAFTIVDAITAMEGTGPTNGKLREMGILIASSDTVSVDAVCSHLIGLDPMDIHTTRIADERRLGEGRLENIEMIGEPVSAMKFTLPSGRSSILNKVPSQVIILMRPLLNMVHVRPRIDAKKCVKCMVCVNSCPAEAISRNNFKINRNKCIMCFCCREFCKYGAVGMQESLLWKIAKKIQALLT